MCCRIRPCRGFRALVTCAVVGALGAVVSLPRPALACSCNEPLSYILPLWGSHDVPRNTRIFVYRHPSGSTWFHPVWELIWVGAVIPDDRFPESLILVSEAQVEIPLDVERAHVRAEGPSTWWLAPRVPLEPDTKYQVRLFTPEHAWTLTEFTTTAEIDHKPPQTLLGVHSVTLSYYPGYQPNNHGDCGGQNALEVRFAYTERIPLFADSPLNGVERLFLRRADLAYDFDAPLVDVPMVATMGPDSDAYPIGWTFWCSSGYRIELDECTQWCVRAHPMDLAGNIREDPTEHCAVLSSLVPYGPDGPGERMVCPGEVGPDPASVPEARDGHLDSARSGGGCSADARRGAFPAPWWPIGCLLVAMSLGRRRRASSRPDHPLCPTVASHDSDASASCNSSAARVHSS